MSNKKLFIILLIIILVLTGWLIFKDVGKKEIKLTYAPGFVNLKLNGKNFKKTKCEKELCTLNIKLKKGPNEISLEKDNFQTIKTTANYETDKEVFLISTPGNQVGRDEYNNDSLMQLQIQNASSAEFSYGSQKTSAKYPFLDQLNIYGGGFTIGYGQSSYSQRDPYAVSLYIDAKEPKFRLDAIDSIIIDLGVSPADIEIIYSDFNNPFKEPVQWA